MAHGHEAGQAHQGVAPDRVEPSRRDGKNLRKTFPTQAAAKAWRAEATTAVHKGSMRATPTVTVREASAAWIAGTRDGSIRNRSGDVYKPSAVRGYEAGLNQRILPDLGATKLSDIARQDVQDLADRMLAKGADPSTIRNAIMPLRVIFRRAVSRGEVSVNPCTGLELPAVRGKRDRIASPEEALDLLSVLAGEDRPIWATALYGGLRRGELMELRWSDVDLAAGIIRVERSYDPKERQVVETKSRAGRRRVPIAAVLRDHLIEHKLRSGRGEGLVFRPGRRDPLPRVYSYQDVAEAMVVHELVDRGVLHRDIRRAPWDSCVRPGEIGPSQTHVRRSQRRMLVSEAESRARCS